MDFNSSQSNSSVTEKPYNINDVKSELQNILNESCTPGQFIRKKDINDVVIEKCLRVIQDIEAFDTNKEFELTVEEIAEVNDNNKIIVGNIQILEHRITNLEKRLSSMLRNKPNFRHISAKHLKINQKDVSKEKLKTLNITDADIKGEIILDKLCLLNSKDSDINKQNVCNFYDNLFYTKRECFLNLLNYKKSVESVELNQRAKLNPHVIPVNMGLQHSRENLKKRRPMFLATNDVCLV